MTAPDPTATLSEGVAQLLDQLGLAVYRPISPGGEVFLGGLPRDPAVAVAITLYSSSAPDARRGYDELAVLLRVRGAPNDYLGPERRAQRLYDELHGLPRGTVLPGTGAVVQRWHADTSGPVHTRRDDQGRHEFNVAFSPVEVRRVTLYRR